MLGMKQHNLIPVKAGRYTPSNGMATCFAALEGV